MDGIASVTGTDNAAAAHAAPTALRQAADEIVGQVFYGTLLRQLRDASLQGKYGHGGRGEEVFQAQLDQVLATRAGRGRSTRITDAIVTRYGPRAEAMEAYRRRQHDELAAVRREAEAILAKTQGEKAGTQEASAWSQ